MLVEYSPAPAGTERGTLPTLSCGSEAATRVSIAHTWSGGSAIENVVCMVNLCLPGGRLRFVNGVLASTEFGVIRVPVPVSICTARQFTSTIRPRAVDVSSQSLMRNGCSNNMNRPDTIWPTEFCSIRPMTTEVTPSAVNRPPIRTPQMNERIAASPTPISANRATSRKMVGSRLRQLSSGAPSNTVALKPDSSNTNTKNPKTVLRIRTRPSPPEIWAALTSSSSRAPSGSRKLRSRPTWRASRLFLRTNAWCSSVSRMIPTGNPRATPMAQ